MAETTVTESETTVTDVDETGTNQQSTEDGSPDESLSGWYASSTLRIGLALVGFFLLLAALGQLSGLDLIGMGVEASTTSVGRWFMVAVVAIALIAAGVYGFGNFGPDR